MTTHASVELLDAMRGSKAPLRWNETAESSAVISAACSSERYATATWAAHHANEEDRRRVDCPDCLRLMREATDPVRYDFLRERGLVPELPLVSG